MDFLGVLFPQPPAIQENATLENSKKFRKWKERQRKIFIRKRFREEQALMDKNKIRVFEDELTML